MSNFSILKDFAEAVKQTGKNTTSPYDTQATVTRIEGDTAWVHIPGGVTETPVKRTIDAKAGDVVQVRVSGGTASLTGNASAPPTDDTKAKEAIRKAEKASGTATEYVTDNSNGIFVHPKDNTADGVRITDAIEIIKAKISYFKVWVDTIAHVRVGRADSGHTVIDSNGMDIYGGDGTDLIAHLGHGTCIDSNGNEVEAPYFDFGDRGTGNIGQQSSVRGSGNVASATYSSAEGSSCTASAYAAKAGGQASVASARAAFAHGVNVRARATGAIACGMYNLDNANDVFSVGNGSDSARANAFSVRKTGLLVANGIKLFNTVSYNGTVSVPATSTALLTIPVSTTQYTPMAIRGFNSSSASCNIYKLYYDDDASAIRVRLYNSTSAAISVTVYVTAFCIATSAV